MEYVVLFFNSFMEMYVNVSMSKYVYKNVISCKNLHMLIFVTKAFTLSLFYWRPFSFRPDKYNNIIWVKSRHVFASFKVTRPQYSPHQ